MSRVCVYGRVSVCVCVLVAAWGLVYVDLRLQALPYMNLLRRATTHVAYMVKETCCKRSSRLLQGALLLGLSSLYDPPKTFQNCRF